MKGSKEYVPYFKDLVVDSVYGCSKRPEIVYAGVTHDGLYRTTDAGRYLGRGWAAEKGNEISEVACDPCSLGGRRRVAN